MANFWIGTLLVFHFLVGIFLVLIVLMQRSKEGGMGAAFGAGVTESLFGASSGNVLTKITVWTAAIFFATSLSMAIIFSRTGSTSIAKGALQQVPSLQPPQPAGTVTPQGTATTPQGTVPTPAPESEQPVVPPQEAPKPPEEGAKPPPAEGAVPKEPAPPPAERATPKDPDAPPSLPPPEAPKVNP
jgi:preprotein translocase subunit SecG